MGNTFSNIGEVGDCADSDNMFASLESEESEEELFELDNVIKTSGNGSNDKLIDIIIGSVVILSVIATIYYYFFLSSYRKHKEMNAEQTPLLNEVGLSTSYS